MDEIPATRPAVRRVDDASADMGTLVDMGVVEPQPEPSPPEPPVEEPPMDPPEEAA